ncbi:MAG TPA: (d)CMP kinase [Chthoniobacterales bacterium]|jgi:cytidylate kinase|nr:(d)CMP kinase [Chthoniobacterales bacterium]
MNPETPDSVDLQNNRVVAIDGGTATGKGRLIVELSTTMRLKGVPVIHISTGSIYRAVAYCGLEDSKKRVRNRSKLNEAELTAKALSLLREMGPERMLELARSHQVEVHGGDVWMDGQEASLDDQLKAPGVGVGASIVAFYLPVREFVNQVTRRQINEFDGYSLVDGRDITHTVVPDSPLKLLLVVSPEVAAERSREHTIEEIRARDESDRRKPHGALRHPSNPGEGVTVIVTDNHSPESIRDHVYHLMEKVFGDIPPL